MEREELTIKTLGLALLACVAASAPAPVRAQPSPVESVVDLERHGGAFYIVQLAPGAAVSVRVPSMCLDFSKAPPTAGSLGGGLGVAPALVQEIIAVHDHMLATLERWEARFASEFDFVHIVAELHAQPSDADMREVQRVSRELDQERRQMPRAIGDLEALAASARRTTEIATRALQTMNAVLVPQVSYKPITAQQRHEAMKELLERATQWAVWRRDPAFRACLQAMRQGPRGQMEPMRALDRMSYVIYETARVRLAARTGR